MVTDAKEKVWFAREVFQLFVKAFTNLKLYPHHHVHAKTAVDAFVDRVRSYVSLHGVLRLNVGQDTFSVGDQVVYEEENRNENLAFRLYVDGLRELSVRPGVTREEAERLAHVFYKAVVDTTSDATLLLWEGDFHYIDYAAINSLSEAWDQPDFLSNDSLQQLRDMNSNADDLVNQLTRNAGDRATYDFELSDRGSELEELARLGDLSDDGEGPDSQSSEDDIYSLEEEQLQQLRQDAMAWGPDRMLQSVVEASLDGLALQPDLIGRENVRWLLTEALEMALRTNDMELLSRFLDRFEGELGLTEEDEDEVLFQYVFEWLGHEQNLSRLVDMVKSEAGVGGPQAFCRILGLLGEQGLHAAVNTYLTASSKELEEALLEFINANLYMNPRALVPLLDKREDKAIVRAGLFLVSKQPELDPAMLEDLLSMGKDHPHPEVKKYAEHLWRTMTDQGTVDGYVDALAAESQRDRFRALKFVVDKRFRPALDKLKEVVESKEFLDWEARERKAYLQAIRILGETASIGFLQRQAQRRTGVFKRAQIKEIREQAEAELEKLKKR